MSNDFYKWKPEDYRRLMLRSSMTEGESYPRPLYDTDPEKWAELFDCTRERPLEPNYLITNLITIIIGITLILFYHFY